ncbi:hypothetical protein KGQ64_01780 [bacterium]|nr:hypothetical protein [bacterium]
MSSLRSPFAALLAVASALLGGCIGAGTNSPLRPVSSGFPDVTGIDLEGREVRLPSGLSGSPRIVVVAFEREQQADVDTWIRAVEPLLAARPSARLYEVPVIGSSSAPFRFWLNNGMRAGIPDEAARRRTVTVYTDRDGFLAAVGARRESIGTLLLDDGGRISWRTDGPADPGKVAGLAAAMDALGAATTP